MTLFSPPYLFVAEAFAPFSIERREIRVSLPPSNHPLLKEIKGFYGLIGPDINVSSVNSLYEIFTGDGMIQGIFCDKGKMTFVKHFVRTDKLVYESIHGRLSKHILMTPLYMFLHKLGLLPNVLGLANTALLPIRKRLFALFERDYPYEILPNFDNHSLKTVKKKIIPRVSHFSGHSKYNNDKIHTIDYDVIWNQLSYIKLTRNFQELSRAVIKTNYIPIVHDFALLPNDKILFVDGPFVWNWSPMLSEATVERFLEKGEIPENIPVMFDETKPTYICLYDSSADQLVRYQCSSAFYLFHVAHTDIQGGEVILYAPFYDRVNFSDLKIEGKYRKITVKNDGRVVIQKNPGLETMNLDFPQKWGKYVILRSIEMGTIRGFVVILFITA
jgi:carotenoid cleavage dioxygenase-like enzyme